MENNFALMETLFRDPEEFARQIEQQPWRLATMLLPMHTIPDAAAITWAEDKIIGDFFEVDTPVLKLPEDWATGWTEDL